jgi:hypothetical protein
MRRAALLLALLPLLLLAGEVSAQQTATTSVASVSSKPKPEIPPKWRCHVPRKDLSFCKVFPNFSRRHGICNPEPELLGHIEWCREDVTITERDDCGNLETYEAVTITYRKVYENGAWGEKFKRTYRKEPLIVTPPVLAKGVVK